MNSTSLITFFTSQENQEDSKRFCAILIETLLGWKIGDVHITPQRPYQGIDTDRHGICLDVQIEAVTYKDGNEISSVDVRSDIYDIEPNTHRGNEAKRVRFYTALIDSRSLQSGVEYGEMKNLYLIMISPYDPFGADSMVYTVKSRCLEVPDISYDDGITCVFLYTKGKKNIPSQRVADMLHFIEESTTDNAVISSECQTLLKMVEKIKSRREVGIRYMKACEIEKMYRDEGRAEGRAETLNGIIAIGRRHHFTDDEILRDLQSVLEISQEEAQEILDNYDK